MLVSKQTTRWAIASLGTAGLLGGLLALQVSFLTGIAGALLLISMAIALRYPRTSLWLFLLYLPFGGTVIYYLGGQEILHLVKDALYLPALIVLLRTGNNRTAMRTNLQPLLPVLLPLLASCLLTLLLVNAEPGQGEAIGSSLLVGAVGLKVLVGYVPLLLAAPLLLRDRDDLRQLLRLHIVLIVICCSLSLLQYLLLTTGVCEGSRELAGGQMRQASLEARCLVGGALLYNPTFGLIRLPGTFVAPWQWAWFLISGSFLATASYVSDRDRPWRVASVIAMGLVLASAIVSGQRVALALVPLVLIVLLLLASRNRWWLVWEVGLFALLAGLLSQNAFGIQQPLVSFIDRWRASPPHQFILNQFRWTIADKDTWLGSGLGRATNAARTVGETKLVETYYAKLVYELGFFGMFAMLALVTLVTILTFRAYRSLRDPALRRLGLCLWLFILLVSYNTFYYPLDVDPVAVYYWFFAGVLLWLPQLDADRDPEPHSLPPGQALRSSSDGAGTHA